MSPLKPFLTAFGTLHSESRAYFQAILFRCKTIMLKANFHNLFSRYSFQCEETSHAEVGIEEYEDESMNESLEKPASYVTGRSESHSAKSLEFGRLVQSMSLGLR